MTRRYKIPISECIVTYLSGRGRNGATSRQIADHVWSVLGDRVPLSSIYSVLYGRLPGAKGAYNALFERLESEGNSKYRLIAKHAEKSRR